MKNILFYLVIILGLMFFVSSCNEDACTEITWYQDADGDGLGNPDISFEDCDQPTGYVENSDDNDDDKVDSNYLIDQSFFNSSSLIKFETINAPLEDGTTAECFRLTFSSNPVPNGPFCSTTIDDVAGLGFYDGDTNPGFRVFSEALLNDIEADGYDMVNDDGTVNVDYFDGGMPDPSFSYCLEAAANDDLELVFIIPAEPKLGSSNNDIAEVELIGLSLDGVSYNGDPPSAVNGPMMGGPGGGGDQINFPSLDPCGGHHDPAGYYHWHFVPEVMNKVLESNGISEVSCTNIEQTTGIQLAGFAKDGFPIYAYADEPSDIDDCGGRIATTNEFPDGVYHYVASTTIASNVPRCLKGVAAQNAFSYQ